MVPPQGNQAADTRADTGPETSQVEGPPEDADRHADRMAVGHAGPEDAPPCSQGDSTEPQPDADWIGPTADGVEDKLPLVRAQSSVAIRRLCRGMRTAHVLQRGTACCSGYEMLLG
jgi:hypothetical protein